ncbi:MAG: M20/M25/M40 family metallo-hydrolase, partial [Anaerolineales bacterium]
YDYRVDYRALTGGYVGAGVGEGPVVWLNECRGEDYTGLDVTGKVVLCHYRRDPQIYREAIEHQVEGLLLLDRESDYFRRGGWRQTAWVENTLPAYIISEEVAADLLAGSDYSVDDLTYRFRPIPLATTVRMAVEVEETEEGEARNVLGLLPGSDPDYADEIIVVGGHFDHLGREPDGEIMSGANDNASGPAVLLEIARSWHAQGFRPARSVLFAAWDAEEQGLIGSRYYVEHPTLPIEETLSNINLDMVGAGEQLYIDGAGTVVGVLEEAVATYDISTTTRTVGGSDHLSFHQAGIPAATLIYWPDPNYHSPRDKSEAIDLGKLRDVGVATSHALAVLADGEVALARAVERLEAALITGDREAYLEGIRPAARPLQARRFDDLRSRALTEADWRVEAVTVGREEAEVALQARYRWEGDAEPTTLAYDLRFVEEEGHWLLDGYAMESVAGETLTLFRTAGVQANPEALLAEAEATYTALTTDLGLEPITGTQVVLHSGVTALREFHSPAAGDGLRHRVVVPHRVELVYTDPLTPALAALALAQLGQPLDEGAWLWEGLPAHYEADALRRYLPRLAGSEVVTPLAELCAASGGEGCRAASWSAVDYLLEEHGAAGLAALAAAWGRTGSEAEAFQEALGLSPAAFEAGWRAARLEPLRAVKMGVDATLEKREAAVAAGDVDLFLTTITEADSELQREEQLWFESLQAQESVTQAVEARLVGWQPDGSEALVALTLQTEASPGPSRSATFDARFVREGGRWRYAGPVRTLLAGEELLIEGVGWDAGALEPVQETAERVQEELRGLLGLPLPAPIRLVIYEDEATFRVSLPPGSGETTVWVPQEGRIRLWLPDLSAREAVEAALAHALAQRALLETGVESEWLREGVAQYAVARVLPLGRHRQAARFGPPAQGAARAGGEIPLFEMPARAYLSGERAALFPAQAWSVVDYIVEVYGERALRRLIAAARQQEIEGALEKTLGVEGEAFVEGWREHARIAGVPSELVELGDRFDGERALGHVEVLSGPRFAGREAGTPGGERAAAYVAEAFQALGLQPVGDPVSDTLTYFQHFPISTTGLSEVPVLILSGERGKIPQDFTYREAFFDVGGEGTVEGDLVWLQTPGGQGSAALGRLRFGGAVVLERDVEEPLEHALLLQERGAGGLIVVSERKVQAFQTRRLLPPQEGEPPLEIPIFEITRPAFDALLETAGLKIRDLTTGPAAQPLGVRVYMSLERAPEGTATTANVLGLLPGRDPELAGEVLIVGAHYDHVGRSVDGIVYPGANQNASGVALLLELAQTWQESNFRPARSVLFAAWGADERGHAGVQHYLDEPTVPLTRTVGVLSAESVGNGRGYSLLFFGVLEPDRPLTYRFETGTAQLGRRAQLRVDNGTGWHLLFNAAGIPTTKLIWGEAEAHHYLPADDAAAVALERLDFSGELLTLATSWLVSR